MKILAATLLIYCMPLLSLAAGLVPCGGKTEEACDKSICHFIKLIDNVVDAFVAFSGVAVVILIIWGGVRIGIAQANMGAAVAGRKLIVTAVIGYILVLAAWMLVDLILKFFTVDPAWGVWNPFSCQ